MRRTELNGLENTSLLHEVSHAAFPVPKGLFSHQERSPCRHLRRNGGATRCPGNLSTDPGRPLQVPSGD